MYAQHTPKCLSPSHSHPSTSLMSSVPGCPADTFSISMHQNNSIQRSSPPEGSALPPRADPDQVSSESCQPLQHTQALTSSPTPRVPPGWWPSAQASHFCCDPTASVSFRMVVRSLPLQGTATSCHGPTRLSVNSASSHLRPLLCLGQRIPRPPHGGLPWSLGTPVLAEKRPPLLTGLQQCPSP